MHFFVAFRVTLSRFHLYDSLYFKTTDIRDPIFCGEAVREPDKRREGDNEVYDDTSICVFL